MMVRLDETSPHLHIVGVPIIENYKRKMKKQVGKEKCNELNINYNLVSVYPWKNIEEELDELNNS